ncbi:MAG: ABC transporter ATP-binding protein [Methylocella sp.]
MSIAIPHIRILGVSHRYRGRSALVLDRISFNVSRGERLAVIGRSGSGKSTLLQLIAGLAHPSSGEVRVNEQPVRAPWPRCNLMFQRPLLFPWLDVAGNVALALRFAGRRNEAPARVEQLLSLVGLAGYAKARVVELSGGQQQRVALARSLAVDPEILLLDEPFSSLDPVTRTELRLEVGSIIDTLGITLILVTHDVDDALSLAARTIVLASGPGRIVADIDTPKAPAGGALFLEQRARLLAALAPEPQVSLYHDLAVSTLGEAPVAAFPKSIMRR